MFRIFHKYYKILPAIHNWCNDTNRIGNGKKVEQDFNYTSDNNTEWMTVEMLRNWINKNRKKLEEN